MVASDRPNTEKKVSAGLHSSDGLHAHVLLARQMRAAGLLMSIENMGSRRNPSLQGLAPHSWVDQSLAPASCRCFGDNISCSIRIKLDVDV